MNWTCPVCQQENRNKWNCDCGFDESKNYEKYKTIFLLSKEQRQNYKEQKGNEDSLYERYVRSISVSCLKRAAELGNPKAQYELGRLYYDGLVERNMKKALYWWKKVGEKENLKEKLGLEYIRQVQKLEKVQRELEESEQENKKRLGKIQVGDIIKFGKNNREWIVLDRQGNKALIITKDIVEKRAYNETEEDNTWEKCTLRTWLNGEFLQQNFSIEERKKIEITLIKNLDNPIYGTRGGKDTQDKVFCLSMEEAEKYFRNDEERAAGSWWWLRSPGYNICFVNGVYSDGYIAPDGFGVNRKWWIRPALWLNLESYQEKSNELQAQLGEKEVRKAQIGDIIKFGKNDREWIVLDRQGNKALIITKNIVEERAYNETYKENITWEECTLRAWLNGEFLQQNFSIEEKNRIEITSVKNFDNPGWGTNGGRDTQDKVFCLSIEEVERYFENNKARAIGSFWQLRSPGICGSWAAVVDSNGNIHWDGFDTLYKSPVRPALWLNLES